jgi:hypothetical protein
MIQKPERPTDLDVTWTILGGPRRWLTEAWPPAPSIAVMWASASIGLLGVGTLTTIGWFSATVAPPGGVAARIAASWLFATAIAVLPATAPWVSQRIPAPAEGLLRGLLFSFLVTLAVPLSGIVRLCLVPAFALFLGSDAAMTLDLIGVRRRHAPSKLTWLLVSPLHLGLVVGGALALATARQLSRSALITAIIFIETILCLAYLVWLGFQRLSERLEHDARSTEMRIKQAEHRKRSHWIHDDVLAELNLGRLSLERGELRQEDLAELLTGIDHRLRLRQLDEVLESGSASIAEIVQPFVRLAMAHGLTQIEVPSGDIGKITLPGPTGDLLKRSLAVTSSNALLANATELRIAVEFSGDSLHLQVEDDAGGFETSDLYDGRGLDILDRDLGPVGGVSIERLEHGSRVTCRIPHHPPQRTQKDQS